MDGVIAENKEEKIRTLLWWLCNQYKVDIDCRTLSSRVSESFNYSMVNNYHHRVKHSIKKVRIVLGSTQLNESDGQIHEVDKLLIHEKYESFNYHNDIAMVKTTSDINFERNSKKFKVNSLCLNTNNTRAIESAKIYGWGLMTENGNRSDGLMKTTLNQFDHKKCSAIYEEYIGDLSPHMICYWDKDKDACQVGIN